MLSELLDVAGGRANVNARRVATVWSIGDLAAVHGRGAGVMALASSSQGCRDSRGP